MAIINVMSMTFIDIQKNHGIWQFLLISVISSTITAMKFASKTSFSAHCKVQFGVVKFFY